MTAPPEKAAPIPAEVHASMLWTIQRFRTTMQPSDLLRTMLTNPVVQNWLADRASQKKRIREDERDRLYAQAREDRDAAWASPDAWAATDWLDRQGAMLPADRARLRGDAS